MEDLVNVQFEQKNSPHMNVPPSTAMIVVTPSDGQCYLFLSGSFPVDLDMSSVPEQIMDEANRKGIALFVSDQMEVLVLKDHYGAGSARDFYIKEKLRLEQNTASLAVSYELMRTGLDCRQTYLDVDEQVTTPRQPGIKDNIIDLYVDDSLTIMCETAHTDSWMHTEAIEEYIASGFCLCTSVADGLARLRGVYASYANQPVCEMRAEALAVVRDIDVDKVGVNKLVEEMERDGVEVDRVVFWEQEGNVCLTIMFK